MLIVYPVADLDKATALYEALLGTEPYAAAPYYVGFRVGDLEVGLDPSGHANGQTGPIPYHEVPDIHAALETLQQAGATVQSDVRDVGGGLLVAWIADADGNVTGLRQMPA